MNGKTVGRANLELQLALYNLPTTSNGDAKQEHRVDSRIVQEDPTKMKDRRRMEDGRTGRSIGKASRNPAEFLIVFG